jgi:hypothetical protein
LNSAKRIAFFKEKSNEVDRTNKKVKDLYIDMTFFKPEIQHIPTREESVDALIEFLKKFLIANDFNRDGYFKNVVFLKTSARIGYEYVLQQIYQFTGYKIHVNELIYQIYEQLPAIRSFLTLDSRETPIHSCIYENRKRDEAKTDLMSCPFSERKCYMRNMDTKCSDDPIYPCELLNSNKTTSKIKVNAVKIILSAMWFTDTAGVDKIFIEYKPPAKEMNTIAYRYYQSIYRLCFSFHSSFAEIIDFVNSIKPARLHSIALPDSTTEKIINDHFYNSNGKFNNFQLNNKSQTKSSSKEENNFAKFNNSDNQATFIDKIEPLKLRKRKSLQQNIDSNYNRDSSSDNLSASGADSDSLNFGSDDDENVIETKKLKC